MNGIALSWVALSFVALGFVNSTPSHADDVSQQGANTTSNRDEDLIRAAQKGDIQKIKDLISQGANVNFKDPYRGASALHYAAGRGQLESVRILIEARADVNARDRTGHTAVFVAANAAQNPVLEELIKAKADINLSANDPRLPGLTPLIVASNNGSLETVRILIKNGVNLNATDNQFGRTALMSSSQFSKLDIVELLLSAGADANIKCSAGQTALQLAVLGNSTKAVEIFIKHKDKVEINAPDAKGITALMFAAGDAKNVEIVKLLLSAGADTKIEFKGTKAIDFARNRNLTEIVNLLETAEKSKRQIASGPNK